MLNVTYTITGVDETRRDLAKLRVGALQSDIADVLDDIAADAATYPPEVPGQRYRRTNRLHDEWIDAAPQFSLSGDTLAAVLENATPYGPPVMGADNQTKAFAGRWRTTDAIMTAWEDRVAARVEDALGRLIGS